MRIFLRNVFARIGILDSVQHLYIKMMKLRENSELYFLLPLLTKSSLLRKIYFAFFSASFSFEMKQYVAGRNNYLQKSRLFSSNAALLRRNIHRFEKGLMAENRKKTFGVDYLLQTIEQFAASVKDNPRYLLNDWAFDVLNEYFRIVEKTTLIRQGEVLFRQVNYIKMNAEISRLPFLKQEVEKDSLIHFSNLAETRKSVRTFVPGSVPPREKIEEAVRLASLSPTSCNRQPFKFYIFEDKEVVESIADLAAGARSFAEGIPALAMVVGSCNVSPSPGDRHLMYIDGSLAAMNFMLALESMGISTCPLNWPDNKKPEKLVRKIVTLEIYERPIMLIAMGDAKESSLVACSVRKEIDELLVFNPK